MPKQTPQQYADFQALCRANNLDPKADVWQQKQSGQWIIGRTGIEKIQGHNNIAIALDVVGFGPDYAGVKVTATRSVKEEGARTAKKLVVESLGSAHPKNCLQISYYLEMAEKRAKSRAILMLMGFSALGIYGEDEADDFQRKADSLPGTADVAPVPAQPAGNAAGGSPTAIEPPVTPAAPPSAAPAPSTTSGQPIAGPAEIPAEVLAKLTSQFEAAPTLAAVGKLWASLTKHEAVALLGAKEAAKVRLAAQPAPAAPESGNLKEAGTDTALVEEFTQQPTMPSGSFAPLSAEQKQQIQRLLDNVLITRKEKTFALLNLNRLDTERARQLLVKLRGAIVEREGYHPASEVEQVGQVRADLLELLTAQAGKLEIEDEGQARAVLANQRASLEELQAAYRAAQEAAWDAETDGTERELAEAETTTV